MHYSNAFYHLHYCNAIITSPNPAGVSRRAGKLQD